jgi:hypothetical protein
MVSIEIGIFAIIANLIRLRAWHREAITPPQGTSPGGLGLQGPVARLLPCHLEPQQSGIPMDEDERLQRLADAKSQIQPLHADEDSETDAA